MNPIQHEIALADGYEAYFRDLTSGVKRDLSNCSPAYIEGYNRAKNGGEKPKYAFYKSGYPKDE